MDQQTLLIVMTAFVCIAAIALLIQAGLLFAIFKTTRAVDEKAQRLLPKVEALLPKVEALVESSRTAVDDGRRQIAEITSRTADILDTARAQLGRVDAVMDDVTERAGIQLDRAEMVLDDAMNRAQETVALVHSGVMKPLRQIQAIAAGLQAVVNYFLRGGRSGNPTRATVDEEMFI
jgi:ABC-type transporter Mla subunit MlaD